MERTRQKRIVKTLIAALACGMVAAPLLANNAFLQDKARGWFWKETTDLPEEPKKVELPPPPPVAAKQEEAKEPAPAMFSVKWFQQSYMDVFERAVDSPTAENVDRYRMATRVMLDKASNITQTFRERAALDVELDENNRYPIASVMRNQQTNNLLGNTDYYASYLKDKAALWVFLDEDCSFCGIQYAIVDRLAKKTGLQVSYIVRQGKPIFGMKDSDEVLPDLGHAEKLGLKLTPSVVMVIPPEKFVVLTQGMLSEDLLSERLILAAKDQGLLDHYQYAAVNPNVAGVLTPSQIESMGTSSMKDPAFSSKIRDLLKQNIEQINSTRSRHVLQPGGQNG